MALSAARLAFGLSLVNEGRGSVEEPFQKRLKRLPVSPKGRYLVGLCLLAFSDKFRVGSKCIDFSCKQHVWLMLHFNIGFSLCHVGIP